MTIFRTRGFDSLIGKDLEVSGSLTIKAGSNVVIEGIVNCTGVSVVNDKVDKPHKGTTLRVSGKLLGTQVVPNSGLPISVYNVIITGEVVCDELRVEGTLALKKGCILRANHIYYRELIIETGAIVHGQMHHRDHEKKVEEVAVIGNGTSRS